MDPAEGVPVALGPGKGSEEDATQGDNDSDNRKSEPGDNEWGNGEAVD